MNKNSLQDKKLNKTKENLLVFLDEIITLLGKRVQDYALDIKVKTEDQKSKIQHNIERSIQKTCVNVFRREQSNTVKQATFGPIFKIIKLKFHVLDAEKLGVRELADQ